MVRKMKNGWYDKGGYLVHYVNNGVHNNNTPSIIEDDGNKYWVDNNYFHRVDGPAIEYYDGNKVWYYQDKLIDCNFQEEFKRIIKLKLVW